LNATEAEALDVLIHHWETGDVDVHIQYSELWLENADPVI
jgi:hypothetical protein